MSNLSKSLDSCHTDFDPGSHCTLEATDVDPYFDRFRFIGVSFSFYLPHMFYGNAPKDFQTYICNRSLVSMFAILWYNMVIMSSLFFQSCIHDSSWSTTQIAMWFIYYCINNQVDPVIPQTFPPTNRHFINKYWQTTHFKIGAEQINF